MAVKFGAPYMRASDHTDVDWRAFDTHTLAAGDFEIALWSQNCAVFRRGESRAAHLADTVDEAKQWVREQVENA